jgi:hypothetical protein
MGFDGRQLESKGGSHYSLLWREDGILTEHELDGMHHEDGGNILEGFKVILGVLGLGITLLYTSIGAF